MKRQLPRTPNIGLQRIRLRSVPELRRDKLSARGLAAESGSLCIGDGRSRR